MKKLNTVYMTLYHKKADGPYQPFESDSHPAYILWVKVTEDEELPKKVQVKIHVQ